MAHWFTLGGGPPDLMEGSWPSRGERPGTLPGGRGLRGQESLRGFLGGVLIEDVLFSFAGCKSPCHELGNVGIVDLSRGTPESCRMIFPDPSQIRANSANLDRAVVLATWSRRGLQPHGRCPPRSWLRSSRWPLGRRIRWPFREWRVMPWTGGCQIVCVGGMEPVG